MLRYNFLFELFSPSHWMSILKCHSLVNKNSSEENQDVLMKRKPKITFVILSNLSCIIIIILFRIIQIKLFQNYLTSCFEIQR